MLRIGTRPSPLALLQAEEIKRFFPSLSFEVVIYQTLGDKDKETPLSEVEGSDFFTRELDQAVLKGEIDLAVHSAKDLPEVLAEGLKIVLETKSISPYDALVSKGCLRLKQLPEGSSIGTSSQRRKEQVKLLRPDLLVVDIRGNIEERIRLVDIGKIDALIVAHAALIRLGLKGIIAEVFGPDLFPAHPKQGSLALISRGDRWQEVKSILSEPAPATGS